jgi:hypothetical protein
MENIQYAQMAVHGMLKPVLFYIKTQITATVREKYDL